jgi:hypothetical protein
MAALQLLYIIQLYLSATVIKYFSILQKALDETNLQEELGSPEASEEPEAEQIISSLQKKVPDPKERRRGRINSLQKNKVDKLKYNESRKAIKVGKQKDLEKLLPLHSILKKYTKHTSVKMVKEKHRNPKRAGVIELCRKSVKRVKFSEANDVLGSNKQSSKIPQLESLCRLFSEAMTSSSSTDMSSEGDRHVAAESSSSHMPEKAFAKANKENENTDHVSRSNLSNTGSSGLFDLNEALPESTELNNPCISKSEGLNVEHTQDGMFSMDEQALDNGRENQKHYATDLDIRSKGKSPYAPPNHTVHDSVQLQQSWCTMTMHHGVSQLSAGGELPSCQILEFNLSQSAKPNIYSERNAQEECWPAAGQTFRLMGKDLTVSTTGVSYLAETSQKHTGPSDKGNLNEKMVLGLPRQGLPFLSLQAPSIPIVSVSSACTVHDSENPASKNQAQFGYRNPHNFCQTLPNANLFSGDPSPDEDRFRDPANSESRGSVLLGYPPVPNRGSESFLQNLQAPWHYYSGHSTRKEPPSESLVPAITRHVTSSPDYHASLPLQYGVYSAGSSVRSHNYVSFTLNNPDRAGQGVSSALPSRNADTGVARAVPENSNASSSSRHVLRSGPVKLSAGAKHILMPNESTVDNNAAPLYSRLSFGSSTRNAPRGKGVDFRKF